MRRAVRMPTIAIISDTHLPRGSRRLPDACVEHLRRADLILHAGDLVMPEVLEEISALGPPVRAVAGNVDVAALREVLPERLTVDVGQVRLGMVHDAGPAAGRLARLARWFPDCDAVVFGHSHIPLHETDALGDFQIFNPGSPTDRRRQPVHTMGIARVDGQDVGFELVALG
jgi:putative phosphoesterase